MRDATDMDLARAYASADRDGQSDVLAEVIRRYQQIVRSTIRSRLNGSGRADTEPLVDDLTQDTWIKAAAWLPKLAEAGQTLNLGAWLATTASNQALDFLRRWSRLRHILGQRHAELIGPNEPSAEDVIVRAETEAEAAALVRQIRITAGPTVADHLDALLDERRLNDQADERGETRSALKSRRFRTRAGAAAIVHTLEAQRPREDRRWTA